MATFFTIGHSTRSWEGFIRVLKAQRIEVLADIRAFPKSRQLPQFNREFLEANLPKEGTRYVWFPALGGYRRKTLEESPHVALRNESFRNYADYTLTSQFAGAIGELTRLAESSRLAYMCAELLYFRCHRMIVSDYLTAHGHEVLHILDELPPKLHSLTEEARVVDGQLIYRGNRLF